jgi:two-component system LytT family sensor kinase
MKNVRERLEVLFGGAALFDVSSRPGRGTKVTLAIPTSFENGDEPQLTPAAVRSSTRS